MAHEHCDRDHEAFKKDADRLTKEASLGATGNFPQGSIGKDDQGELKCAISIRQNRLLIAFGKPIDWLALTKAEAIAFAQGILKKTQEMP